jgi:hypothetical protein
MVPSSNTLRNQGRENILSYREIVVNRGRW